MNVLVTGGLGYLGSHACVALAEAGHRLVVVDNLRNSRPAVFNRIAALAPGAALEFYRADLRDRAALEEAFARKKIDAVVHFAGLKSVADSVASPVDYYDNNVGGSIALLAAMRRHGVTRIVYSSSATVYGEPERLPYTERHPLRPANPYGKTKLVVEHLLADSGLTHAALRYFNPIGAHPSGHIGEAPQGAPNNLLPYVAQVAIGRRAKLRVFGDDYDTKDGTGVRDYVHVMDLAAGHLAALAFLEKTGRSITCNLGTGRGYTVLEVLKAFERACGKPIPYEIVPRRAGDIAAYWADASLARRELGWKAALGLAEMCRDAWRWQSQNPDGYV